MEEYKNRSVQLSTLIVEDLQHVFRRGDIQISYSPDVFFERKKRETDDYSHIQTDKDAILGVGFGPVGYVADGIIDAPYEPWFVVHVRLLQGKTKQTVLQKTYTAGYKAKLNGAVFVPCATDYRFRLYSTLMEDFTKTIEGLLECEKTVVRQIAQDILVDK
jgi:hypothetical protein